MNTFKGPHFDPEDVPSAQEAHWDDCYMQLGLGRYEDVADVVDNMDDPTQFYKLVAECLRLVREDRKDHAFLAVNELRDYLAVVMAKERA